MKEFAEKLIERLEERIDGNKKYTSSPMGNDARNQIIGLKKAIQIAKDLVSEHNNDFCEWEADDKEIDVYYTKCGQVHIFIDGNPEENNHVFCPYCGKKIKVVDATYKKGE